MIYEQRIYTCIPGKLPALLSRFENHTLKIWERHGIRPAGFWTVLIGEGNHDLHYMLAWDSLADREKKWNAFQADPSWRKARDESEKDGPLIANIKSALLRPTLFSTVK
jgi:NIPSNAP